MSRRAQVGGITLDVTDAALIKEMHPQGDRQHDIAAWFGDNSGRIAEIAIAAEFPWVALAPVEKLPMPGPHLSERTAHAGIAVLGKARATVAAAEDAIRRRM